MSEVRFIIGWPVALLLATGCATFPANRELATWDRNHGYRFENLVCPHERCDETFIVLSLSGGGTRAAAFAYGAMLALDQQEIAPGRTLLDEVDVISSVSGGSFAAGYLGVYGKSVFLRRFRADVLDRKIETALMLRMLAPWNWWKLASRSYGRGDLTDSYYDRHIFGRRTFQDLPRKRPFIVLNATDLSIGSRFSFTQDHFDRLCSDLDQVSVSRGVTASSAFPIVFSPLTLHNYPDTNCSYPAPKWTANALERDLELNPARYDRARAWRSYAAETRRFVHLSDGGLADNIGLRGPIEGLLNPSSSIPLIPLLNKLDDADNHVVRRVVFIIVDARPGRNIKADASARPPGIVSVLSAAATNPMENYSSDTVDIARNWIREWTNQFSDAGEEPPQAFYRIHVRFDAEHDPAERQRLQTIPTRLQLPRPQVQALVDAGARLLTESHDYQCLLSALRSVAPLGCPESG